MTIQTGDKIPAVTLKKLGANGLEDVHTDALFAGRKVILFGVPGAFTPSCAQKHLPGYVAEADNLKSKGVDEIICVAVNDPFVMNHWGEFAGATGKVTMLPDGNGEFVSALGLTFDGSGAGLGKRALRFAMIVEDGVVTDLQVEEKPSDVELTSANACALRL